VPKPGPDAPINPFVYDDSMPSSTPRTAVRRKSKVTAPAAKQRILKRGQGIVDEVYELIRGDIMALRIKPDTRISIDNLVRQLGVSQTPIREALSRLEATGLVTKQHFVDELYEMRLLLEPYAARCAAEQMSDTQLQQVVALAEHMEPGASRTSYDRFADQDSEFHDLIASGSGNHLVRDALAGLHTHLHIFRLRFHSEVTKEACNEHAKLIAALTRRQAAEAESAMRAHIDKSYKRLKSFARD